MVVEETLDIGIEQLRDRLVFLETGDERLLVFSGGPDPAEGPPERAARERSLQDMELFIQCRAFLERRVNPQLAAENLFLKLARS